MTQPALSILDQSPVGEGFTSADALASTIEGAREAERLGYRRFWVAEHHWSPGFAGAAPEVLAAVLLARTSRIRIGTGGVLLPRYPAEKVAEVFGTLASLYPERVDMGIGRAGGPAERFPEQLSDLLGLLGMAGGSPQGRRVTALPAVPPELWLLGAGTGSAQLAGALGSGFAFAHFLNPGSSGSALDTYRDGYTRATGDRAPGGVLAVRAVTADTAERAEELALAMLLWRTRKDMGMDLPLPSAEEVRSHRWTPEETARAQVRRDSMVSGTPEEVRDTLAVLAKEHGVDELMVNTLTCDPAEQLRSYQLLAEAFDLGTGGRDV